MTTTNATEAAPDRAPWDVEIDQMRDDDADTSIAEVIADYAVTESGLNDRPRCDPRTFAVSYLDLRLSPAPGMRPRLDGGIVWYPSDVPETWQAYAVAHECGHSLVKLEANSPACDWTIEAACVYLERFAAENPGVYKIREALCSRIGRALLLPRAAFLRDADACGNDVQALAALWPLCHPHVVAMRLLELRGPEGAQPKEALDY